MNLLNIFKIGLILLFSALLLEQRANTTTINVVIDYNQIKREVNDMLFGSNIEWVDNGSGILSSRTGDFDKLRLNVVKDQIRPTSLRFPGGLQADVYHWKNGIGDISTRVAGRHYFKKERVASNFGTEEFLRLCKKLEASPIITVNIVTGTAEEAGEWAEYIKKLVEMKGYPRVLFWEIGNEQYLENKFGRFSPEQYVKVFTDFAEHIRSVDPSAKIGALFVGREIEDFYKKKYGIGWNELLLRKVSNMIDYGCLHNAYYPGMFLPSAKDPYFVFEKTIASVKKVEEDYSWLHALLKQYHADNIKLALTEYSSFFGINNQYANYITTLGGGLYIANLLQSMLKKGYVDVANHWALLDEWYCGLFFGGRIKRPSFYVMQAYLKTIGKDIVFVSQDKEKDRVKLMAVRDKQGQTLLLYIINNDLKNAHKLHIKVSHFLGKVVKAEMLYASSLLANNEDGINRVRFDKTDYIVSDNGIVEIGILPHSLTVIKWER